MGTDLNCSESNQTSAAGRNRQSSSRVQDLGSTRFRLALNRRHSRGHRAARLRARTGLMRCNKNVGVGPFRGNAEMEYFVSICRRGRAESRSLQWAALVPSASAQFHRSHFERPSAQCATTLGGGNETSPPKAISASGRGRCRLYRASLGRKPIRRGRCVSSWVLRPRGRKTFWRGLLVNGCRSD